MTIRKQTSDFSFNLKQSTMFFSLPTKYFHTNANKSINPNGGLTVTALISDDWMDDFNDIFLNNNGDINIKSLHYWWH